MSNILARRISQENYKRFCALNGSDYIASEFALLIILKLIRRFKIKSVLELGMGIGSVSDTVLKYVKAANLQLTYHGTEKNEFCLSVLPSNVEELTKVKLYDELKNVVNEKFDFIIIDGQDESLNSIQNYINKRTILFVEGDRKLQTQTLLKIFPKHYYVNIITLKKNPSYVHGGSSTENYLGGGQLIFIEPNFLMKVYWLKEKISTFIKRKIRKLNK